LCVYFHLPATFLILDPVLFLAFRSQKPSIYILVSNVLRKLSFGRPKSWDCNNYVKIKEKRVVRLERRMFWDKRYWLLWYSTNTQLSEQANCSTGALSASLRWGNFLASHSIVTWHPETGIVKSK
jgi:hypothetical protein